MRLLKIFLLTLALTGCQPKGLASQTIVDMLELSFTEDQITATVEYRVYQGKDAAVTYGTYQSAGDSLWQALGNIEKEQFVHLYLQNTDYLNIVATDMQDISTMLEQASKITDLHPKCWVTTSTEPILSLTNENTTMAQHSFLQPIFSSNGVGFGSRFMLKDVLISQNDLLLPTLLPIIRESQSTKILALNGANYTILDIKDCVLLPIADVFAGASKIYLPNCQQEIILQPLTSFNWVQSDGDKKIMRLTVNPKFTITHNQYADVKAVEDELYALIKTAVQESVNQQLLVEDLDLFMLQKANIFFGNTKQSIKTMDILVDVGV